MYFYKQSRDHFKPDDLGSLYYSPTGNFYAIEDWVLNKELGKPIRPIIYIGGQMEHRWHIFEQTGITFDPGHSLFNGSWMYDYSIFTNDKDRINAKSFTENFIKSLEMADLEDVDIITHSFGGIIGALATNNERIHKVYAVHPPATGTPLANPKYIDNYKHLLNKEELLLLKLIKLVINPNYGFEKDNFNGLDLRNVNLNKLVVIGSSLNPEVETGLNLNLYNMVKKVTGYENDGVVIFDEALFNRLGINYVKENSHNNHFASGTKEAFDFARELSKKA